MCEFAKNDEEDDEARDPRPELVGVHNLVAKECDEECRTGDDDDAGVSWNVGVDGV